VNHIALLHNLREENREHGQWNEAADLEMNKILLDAGFDLPAGYLDNPTFHNIEAEEIYNRLPKKGKGKDGQGKGDPAGTGEVRPYPSPSGKDKPTPSETAQQRQTQEIEVQAALTIAKRAGHLPAGLERLLDKLLEPVIPWREVLARFIDSTAKNDYTWQRPNKRYIQQGLYLPSLQNPEIGHLLLSIDTSGSISQKQITEMISEVAGILSSYANTQLTIIFCDTDIQGEPITIDSNTDLASIQSKGGGGTSFAPPFQWAEEERIEPKAMIYFTDGYSNDFATTPSYDVLWILTNRNESFTPPYGEVITMRD
jgi:predicted metal-dependent peptidase